MSKTINPDKMSKFDRQYLADRGIDPDNYEANFTLDDYGNVVPREEEEAEDAVRNQAAPDAFGLQPLANPDESDEEDEDPPGGSRNSSASEDTDGDSEDYSTWDGKRLQAEIASRNEGRDEDSQIVPEGTGKEGRLRKSDLVSALHADDANNAGDDE